LVHQKCATKVRFIYLVLELVKGTFGHSTCVNRQPNDRIELEI